MAEETAVLALRGKAMQRWVVIAIGVVLAIAALLGATFYHRYLRNVRPPVIEDALEHFKYGSIGAEVNGFPFAVWRVLPEVFPDRLPGGWAGMGFLYEPGRSLPIGLSVRRYGVERVGFNCATCHTNRVDGSDQLLLGAPAERLDLQRYQRFLMDVAEDPRFNADTLIPAMRRAEPGFDWLDALVYRHVIIPRLRAALTGMRTSSAWMDRRAPHGPGRTDAGNPWRYKFGMHPERDDVSGATDFPHIWGQALRRGSPAHWDGNNSSLAERNLSAALAGGATPDSLDHPSIERVAKWSLLAPAPRFPGAIDTAARARGRAVFDREGCAACHDPRGAAFAKVTAINAIGTDRDRSDVFSLELLRNFASVGKGKPWQFRHYRKSDGYVNLPLDGIWARGPYLHNGSVPTLDALLQPPEARPVTFRRGCTRLDPVRVGFACDVGPAFDTRLRGNSNAGHAYGTAIGAGDRADLIAYLKGL